MSKKKWYEGTQFEYSEKTNNERRIIYLVGFTILIAIAICVPERYSVLCFLGAIIISLFEIGYRLIEIYIMIEFKINQIILKN